MITTEFNDTYEIKSLIGKGGMSTVYLAEHKRLHTRWAVKEVRKVQGTRFDFLAESNILKKLQHPMLPRIVDIFEDNVCIYIVEDYVEGITLDDLLKREKQVDEATGLQWYRDLCKVLDFLHNQKPNPIIYRDMKPSNIMLQPDGTLKLIDFGIAREYKAGSSADTTYIGTKGYAAPEQFGRAQTDARTDIYSLGVTMYHLITGKSPYEPPYQFVPVRQLDPRLSHGIEYILNKCTQPEPSDRYQSIAELVYDIDHIYIFDKAWKRYKNTKYIRITIISVMLLASAGLMAGGRYLMNGEKEAEYVAYLEQANELMRSDYDAAAAILQEARELFPNRPEAYRQQAYALYANGRPEECVSRAVDILERFGDDARTRLIMATAQFDLKDYASAADNFYRGAQDSELSVDNLRDYAVSLGRLGQIDAAGAVLSRLEGEGANPEVTAYVQGEVYYAQENYTAAEAAFKEALTRLDSNSPDSWTLIQRCYHSLGEVYRDCTALDRIGASPIETPASKSAEVLSKGMMLNALRFDSTFWEMLAMAYFEAYHTDPSVSTDYLNEAADCFNRVIELGITNDYLYSNLYTIYYEMGDYEKAEEALVRFEQMDPQNYMPKALRGILLITIENEKEQLQRNYGGAVEQYELAGQLLRGTDDSTYYQQLGGLIDNLRTNGWL